MLRRPLRYRRQLVSLCVDTEWNWGHDMGLLDGKVAVITGAGSGMGKASVEVFVREGAKVVAADISGAEKDTAAEVGEGVLPIHCDIDERGRGRGRDARRGRGVRAARRGVQRRRDRRRGDARRRHHRALQQADRGRPAGRVPRHQAGDPGHARGGQRRCHRQLGVARRPQRRAVHERVLGREGRRHQLHQGGGGRVRQPRASARTASARASSTPR